MGKKHISNGRCEVLQTDGDPRSAGVLRLPDGFFVVFVSTYVLDLLSEEDIAIVLAEAWRLLRPGGRLALSGITYGAGLRNRFVVCVWELIHLIRPQIVGGCRHQHLLPYIE